MVRLGKKTMSQIMIKSIQKHTTKVMSKHTLLHILRSGIEIGSKHMLRFGLVSIQKFGIEIGKKTIPRHMKKHGLVYTAKTMLHLTMFHMITLTPLFYY